MSTNQQVKREQQTDRTAAREIATFFARLGTAGMHPRLRAVTGSSQFNIEGAGTWRVAFKDGVVTVSETGTTTTPSSADAVVTATAEDMVRVLRGEGYLNPFCAALQETMAVRGDPAFTTTLLEVCSFGQGGMEKP
jgi:hypothetical protein